MMEVMGLEIIIEQQEGDVKSLEDCVPAEYPLKEITYPTRYGYIRGTMAEDGDPLDVFVGTGDINGTITVSRPDCDKETKMLLGCTHMEIVAIHVEFCEVILDEKVLGEEDFLDVVKSYEEGA